MRDPIIPEAMLVGYFDYAVFALLLAGNIWAVRHHPRRLPGGCWFGLAVLLLYGLLLPLLSMDVELNRTRRPPGTAVDGFELVYTYLRFPLYWALLLLQLLGTIVYEQVRRRSTTRSAQDRSVSS